MKQQAKSRRLSKLATSLPAGVSLAANYSSSSPQQFNSKNKLNVENSSSVKGPSSRTTNSELSAKKVSKKNEVFLHKEEEINDARDRQHQVSSSESELVQVGGLLVDLS